MSAAGIVGGRHVLVTGGTGSLGSAMVARLLVGAEGRPSRITVFSRDEAKQHDLRLKLRHLGTSTDDAIYADAGERVRFRVGDIRDPVAVRRALVGVDLVVHAAAMKQVPTCEYSPREAVRTNVEGASVLVEEVRAAGSVEAVIGVSTDKACLPINVMGMTKALMERVLIEANLADGDTRYLCVRYGNVIASWGSVVPMLYDQLASGGPLTLTDEAMTRFLITLDGACDTVFAALADGRAGEVWVPQLGAARMVDLIHAVRGDAAVDVQVTGIRPGEKMHEQLVSEEEATRTVQLGGYGVIQPLLPELARRDAPTLSGAWTSAAVDLSVADLQDLLRQIGLRAGRVKVLTVAGTRPEVIRLSRLIPALDDVADHVFVHTGQNQGVGLRDQFFDELRVRQPDVQFHLPDGSPAHRIGFLLSAIDEVLSTERPDRLVILGDTDSGLSAYAAARRAIPIFHLEAGNRAYDDAVPEEINRRVIDHVSTVLLPYTHRSAANLAREGISADRIRVIGNPISEVLEHHRDEIAASTCRDRLGVPERFVLATLHRAETTDDPAILAEVVRAIAEVGAELDLPVVFPVHPRTAQKLAAIAPLDPRRFLVTDPLGLFDFVHLESLAPLVLTDSGTVQEEAALFGVPTVVTRDVTERPELVDCGAVLLGGRTRSSIAAAARRALAEGSSGEVPPEYRSADVARRAADLVVGPVPPEREA